jgi:predicted 3-demethylubiquinone-9 3-methyltransferase (glyoxalase superfamily)
MSVSFELEGQPFIALNGGPMFKFTEAVSLFVTCKDQKEVDYYWQKLLDGGAPSRCGWLKDRWGLSWQIVPRALGECLGGADREGAQRAMQAMLKMSKLDVQKLKAAYKGKAASPPKARRTKGA